MKGEKEKKEKRQIAQLLWAKGIAICNISVDCSIEFSTFKKTTNNRSEEHTSELQSQ